MHRSQRGILLVSLIAAVGALGWFALRGSDAPAEARAPDGKNPTASPRGASSARVATLATPPSELDALEPDTAIAARSEGFSLAGEPVESLELLAIDKASRAPIAGAAIRWLTSREELALLAEAGRAGERRPDDAEERVALGGHELASDAQGRVRLVDVDVHTLIVARSGRRFAAHRVTESDARPVVLELEMAHVVRVRVVDAAGLPVRGVPVRFGIRGDYPSKNFWLGTTAGVRGELVFRIPEQYFDPGSGPQIGWAELDMPLFSQPDTSFDACAWIDEPLVLTLPPTGSLVAHIVDAQGEPARDSMTVTLQAGREDIPGADIREKREPTSVFSEGGVARFAHVGLGLDLALVVMGKIRSRRVERVAGPRTAGEEVEVTIELPSADPAIVLRLLSAPEHPLADEAVSGNLAVSNPSWGKTEGIRAHTDGEGRVTLPLRLEFDPLGTRTLTVSAGGNAAAATLRGTLDLSFVVEPGERDLGDLLLAPTPLVVAGRVVDPSGVGIEKASVSVDRAQPDAAGPGGVRWNGVSALTGQSDAVGAFALRGDAGASPLRLRARRPGFADAEPVAFRAGSEGVEIVLARSGTIEGSLALPAGVVATQFEVRASWPATEADQGRGRGASAAGEDAGHVARTAKIQADGRFRIGDVPPGSVSVVVSLPSDPVALLTIEDVIVESGATAHDPRLEQIDLGSLVRVLVVRVLDAERRAVERGWVRADRRGETRSKSAELIEGGEARLLLRQGRFDLEVTVPEHFSARIVDVPDESTVVLEPSFAVVLHLAEDHELPAPPWALQASLARAPGEGENMSQAGLALLRRGERAGYWEPALASEGSDFGASRELRVFVSELGKQEVRFVLVNRLPDGMAAMQLDAEENCRRVEIGPGDADRVFIVRPDPESLAAGYGAMR